jgi:hypothetical protein
MRDAKVKGATHHCAAIFKSVHFAKVVPESERDGWKFKSAVAAPAVKIGVIVARGSGNIIHGTIKLAWIQHF